MGSPAGGCPHALLRYCQKPVLRLKAQTSAAPVRGIAGMLKRTSMLISMHSLRLLSVLLLLSVLVTHACSTSRSGTRPSSGKMPTATGASMQVRKNIVSKAREYVGSTYKYSGTSPGTGFDCSGFTYFVFKQFNVEVSPSSAEQSKQGAKVALDKVKPADLVFFGDGSRIQHVAMVVERNKDGIVCVHSTTSRGVIVENVSASTYWSSRLLFARDVLSR